MTSSDLYQRVLSVSSSRDSVLHGPRHWERVARNVVFLAESMDVSAEVGLYFAIFHDALRENDGIDPGHGRRGAELAAGLRAYISLNDQDFVKLSFACRHHTDLRYNDDPVIGLCWDADRLDLGRVNMQPQAEYFNTAAAREIVHSGDFSVLQEHDGFVSRWYGLCGDKR